MSLSIYCIRQFIYLGFNITFNTVLVISQRVFFYSQSKPVHRVGQASVL